MARMLLWAKKRKAMKQATKTTTKKITKKDTAVKADHTAETIAFLEERIADGGATTDHLKAHLDKLRPPQKTEEEAA